MTRMIAAMVLVCGVAMSAPFVCAQDAAVVGMRVECRGQLRHGVVSVGGETTGTTITFEKMTWELKLPDAATRTFAERHNKEPVYVTGTLRFLAGVETRGRWILDVEKLTESDPQKDKEGASAKVQGKLIVKEPTSGKPLECEIAASGITLPLNLSDDVGLPARAQSAANQVVVVNGTLERVANPGGPLRMRLLVRKLDLFSSDTTKP
jgi:hypothetical protein